MITTDEIEKTLHEAMEGAVVGAIDLTGTQDHFEVRVAWEGFKGKSLIAQHQCVNKALAAALQDGRIHALKIKTLLPQ